MVKMDTEQLIKNEAQPQQPPPPPPAANSSSAFYLTMSVGEIRESPHSDNPTYLSITAVLHYCKCKILRPYLRLLGITGLHTLTIDDSEINLCMQIVSYFYSSQVILLMIVGYILQYMACFRRDRGFCYQYLSQATLFLQSDQILSENKKHEQICQGSVLFSNVIPSLIHLFAYLYAVVSFRSSDIERLPSLAERVFLSSSHLSDGFVRQKRLVRVLWMFVAVSIFWTILSCSSVIFMMLEGNVYFKWINNTLQFKHYFHYFSSEKVIWGLKIFLIISTLWHDIIQATIILNYCLQAQLLTSYVYFLRDKLLQSPIQPIDWMREISEFKKLLKYLNEDLAPPVCLFTYINVSWVVSGIIWLLGYDKIDKETFPIIGISILNIGLWMAISLAPFVQAARLTSACQLVKDVGHEVRTRPFVHQDTPRYELDSLLLYASSLKLSAVLFKVPITGRVLFTFLTTAAIAALVIGQCHYLIY